MKRLLAASLVLLAFTAGCETETRVVSDDTVGHRFAAFSKGGWGVSGGGIDDQRAAAQPRGPVRHQGNGPNPFGPSDIQWTTNFQTDQPRPVVPPPAPTQPPPSTIDPMTGQPLAH